MPAMKHALQVATLVLALTLPAAAAELVPFSEGSLLGAQLRGLRLPQTLHRDLTSGLTNRMLIRMTLSVEGRTISQSVIAIGIKYDLWEESFRMTVSVDDRELPARALPNTDAVLALLADMPLHSVMRSNALQPGAAHTLQAEVLFDPIDRERMENIRRWVAQTSALPGESGQSSGASSPSAALFNAIFEQYAAGAAVAATSRDTAASAPFKPDQLKSRPGGQQ
jgi:hypothetical protein